MQCKSAFVLLGLWMNSSTLITKMTNDGNWVWVGFEQVTPDPEAYLLIPVNDIAGMYVHGGIDELVHDVAFVYVL